MSFGGGFGLPPGVRYGAFSSRRNDGRLVVDVSGPFLGQDTVPIMSVCPRCLEPVYEKQVRIAAVPVADFAPGKRCAKGHSTVLPDYLNVFDNTPQMEPRILHLRRPTEPWLLGSGWITRSRATGLLEATAAILASTSDEEFDRAAAGVSQALPTIIKRTGDGPWTRDQKINVALTLITALSVILPLLLGEAAASSRMADIIEQQQRFIERQQDSIDRATPDPGDGE